MDVGLAIATAPLKVEADWRRTRPSPWPAIPGCKKVSRKVALLGY
jgi:hypothetical protein